MNIKYPLRFVIVKKGEMKYFSQLDIYRLIERALRRSKLPVWYSRGFRPRVKISFDNSLKLGEEGKIGVCFYFQTPLSSHDVLSKLLPQFPDELEIQEML